MQKVVGKHIIHYCYAVYIGNFNVLKDPYDTACCTQHSSQQPVKYPVILEMRTAMLGLRQSRPRYQPVNINQRTLIPSACVIHGGFWQQRHPHRPYYKTFVFDHKLLSYLLCSTPSGDNTFHQSSVLCFTRRKAYLQRVTHFSG